MSRNNTHYWNLCVPWHSLDGGPDPDHIGPDGFCDWHRGTRWRGHKRVCIPPRTFMTRRGPYTRKPRYPKYSGRFSNPPPASLKKLWNRQIRRVAERELRRYGEVQADLDKLLAGWYQWYD